MKAKNYPGPWQHEYDENAELHSIFIPADIGVYEIATLQSGFSEELDAQIEANAHMIVAAPDMLKSLKLVCRDLTTLGTCKPDQDYCLDCHVRKSIAKAEATENGGTVGND